jgi:hypothetical protein
LDPRIPRRAAFALAALLCVASPGRAGQDVVTRDEDGRATIRAVRTTPLRIDGRLDDPLYSTVPPISGFVQVEPQVGVPSAERTEMWVAFDDDNFYVTFKNWESEPGRRVASDMRRDGNVLFNADDVVNLYVDPFLDRRNGISITVNSIGGRNDGQLFNDQYNRDWNPIWDFAVADFEGGWVAEYALPFRSLRYRQGREQTWGINALRAIRWRNELSVLSPVPQGMGMSSAQHAALAGTVVGIEAPPPARNLDIKPYAISTLTTDRNVTPRIANDFGRDAGLDVKYAVTQNLVADFTYNTDFAQVEADEQQVNLTRFSLFFPEKREFFLENQGLFHFGGVTSGSGDAPMLFYSRRIGLDAGRPVPIEAGGRLTGRVGRYTVGVVDIQTDDAPSTSLGAGPAGARGSNFSVVRLKRDILRRSSVGLLLTGRSVAQRGAGSNAAYGVDGTFNFFDYLGINTYWARTDTGGLRGNDTSYRAQLDYAGDRYGLQLERLRIGEDFNPEVGFVRRPDIERSQASVRFSPRPRGTRAIRRYVFAGSLDYFEDGTGRLDSRDRAGEFALEFQNGDRLNVLYANAFEFIPSPFRIASGVTLPVGGYSWDNLRVGFNASQQRRLTANVAVEHGTFYNGHRSSLAMSRGRVNLTPKFSFEPTYTVNRVRLVQGSFTQHLSGSRVTYTMSPRMFVSALVQFNSSNNATTANARFRWEYQPGSELFIVYNDERDTRARGFPEMTTRAFVVKVNRLFRF